MDVRCEHCRTEYEFDDARISEAGVTVKCTVCNHVFKVKKKALVVTEPVRLSELDAPLAPPALPSPGEAERPREREWKVRQASGNVFTFKELTTLQKWIVERKVSRDDEISLTGESWKRLGNIAELASFFQVVEAADRAATLASAPAAMYGAPPPPSMFSPANYGQPMASAAPLPAAAPPPASPMSAPIHQPTPQVAPAPQQPPPVLGNEPDEAELAAVRGGGKSKYVLYVLVAIVFGIGTGAILFKTTAGSFNPATPLPSASTKPGDTAEPGQPPTPKAGALVAAKPEGQPPIAKPEDTPAVAKPEGTPAVAKPEGTPAVAKPDDTPAVAKPDAKPAVAKPDDKPAVAKPDDKPAVAKPD
ncbi:MAG: zinc-ribbon domain-containing protein, partial [Deltaproteobacteria bacterium]|nr:zinc-ribbon domain-containing protein [Deltaproteobacteria bacterium]